MTQTNRHLLTLLAAALVGAAGCGLIHARRQSARIAALQKAATRTSASVDRLRRDARTAQGHVEESGPWDQPATATTEPPVADADLERRRLLAGRLRQFTADNPAKSIPEFALFSDADWLVLAETLPLDSEEGQRKALLALRAEAKMKVGPLLQDALRDYAAAHDGQLPADVAQLAAHLPSWIPAGLLERYDMLKSGTLSDLDPSDVVLAERIPVEERDTRQVVTLNGFGQTPVTPARYLGLRALAAYAQANPGQKPASPLDLQPYLEAPLTPEALEAFYRGWESSPGFLGEGRSRWNNRKPKAEN